MKVYNIGSGNDDPDNDCFRMYIAMDADSASTIRIYESGGSGIIEYNTSSDYIYSLRRKKYFTSETVPLKSTESGRMGYPSGMAWVPGPQISSLSDSYWVNCSLSGTPEGSPHIESGNLPTLTQKEDLNQEEFLVSGKIIPAIHYDTPWCPSYTIRVENPMAVEGDVPFISVQNNDTSTTGIINIFSSSQNGAVLGFDIKRDLTSGEYQASGDLQNPEKFSPQRLKATDKASTAIEWNSMFTLSDGCNANSTFLNGENRDEEFMRVLDDYLNEHWYGKLKNQKS